MKAKRHLSIPIWWPNFPSGWSVWLPTRGNILFTLLLVGLLVIAQSVGALPQSLIPTLQSPPSTGTIAYQGRLADADGNPLTSTVPMIFRLYDSTSASAPPLWEEQWTGSNGVQVSDGLFNVMLGSLAPIPAPLITSHPSLFLGITVGTDDEMDPRVQLGSVPFAVQALTVPDGSVSTSKIADGAVTQAKLGADVSWVPPDGSITAKKLALRADQISRGIRNDNTVPVESTDNLGSISSGMDAANIAGVDGVRIVTSGGDILVLASVLASAAGPRTYVIYAVMDNSVVCRSVRTIDSSVGTSLISCLVEDVPGGTHTFLLKHSLGSGEAGVDIQLRDRILNVIEVGK